MCLMCVELTKGTLRREDFIKNLPELVETDPEHAVEVYKKVFRALFFDPNNPTGE